MVGNMENIYLSNNYKIDLERLEVYDSEGNTIEINTNTEGLKVVKLNWIFGLKEYPLALVVLLTGFKPTYPLYVIENIVSEGIRKGELIEGDSSAIASRDFWLYLFNNGI